MARRRFYIPRDQIQDGSAVLTQDQSHHLRDVLRLRTGDEVELFDGKGFGCTGRVESLGAEIRVGSLKPLPLSGEPACRIILAAALIKPERFEWMLQKGTELGIERFLPLETRFSSTSIKKAALEGRLTRWQRIVQEAAKQCRRLTVPKVHAPMLLADLLNSSEYQAHARIMLYEKSPRHLRESVPADLPVLLCVGPEGGWDSSEAEAAGQAGFQLVSMGTRILRAETAALAAIAVLQFLLETSPGR